MAGSAFRRGFLQSTAAGGAMLGLGDLKFVSQLKPVSAAETRLDAKTVQLRPEIEPLVRFIEETPRERLIEETAQRIRNGLSYQELLAALLLAGVRNIEPRPAVGFKFHGVLVVNSAHLASLASPAEYRWLPIFWALDYFKVAAAQSYSERNGWTLSKVDEAAVPPAHRAREAFSSAMDAWDESAADVAVAALARSAGEMEAFQLFCRYGARDFRSIGHKAIYVANSWRTLQCIGWQHAEPVLRSLAYALLMHEGENPRDRDDAADRPFRRNQELSQKLRSEWLDGQLDHAATIDLVTTLRSNSPDEACDLTVAMLNRGVSVQSIWDGLHVAAGEMLMRQPAIIPLHAVTTTNALHYAFQACGDDATRRLLLLQNVSFLPMFRQQMLQRGGARDIKIDDLTPAEGASDLTPASILGELSRDPLAAASQTLAFAKAPGSAEKLIDAARVLVFLKGNDAHDYKFSSAVMEDYGHVSPDWRDIYLASNVFKLCGAAGPDNELVARTRAALGG